MPPRTRARRKQQDIPDLPGDQIAAIGLAGGTISILCTMAAVCRSWRAAVGDDALWRPLALSLYPRLVRIRDKFASSRAQSFRALCIQQARAEKETLLQTPRRIKKLESYLFSVEITYKGRPAARADLVAKPKGKKRGRRGDFESVLGLKKSSLTWRDGHLPTWAHSLAFPDLDHNFGMYLPSSSKLARLGKKMAVSVFVTRSTRAGTETLKLWSWQGARRLGRGEGLEYEEGESPKFCARFGRNWSDKTLPIISSQTFGDDFRDDQTHTPALVPSLVIQVDEDRWMESAGRGPLDEDGVNDAIKSVGVELTFSIEDSGTLRCGGDSSETMSAEDLERYLSLGAPWPSKRGLLAGDSSDEEDEDLGANEDEDGEEEEEEEEEWESSSDEEDEIDDDDDDDEEEEDEDEDSDAKGSTSSSW